MLAAVAAGLAACGGGDDAPVGNQRPSVLITGGIVAIPPEQNQRDSVGYAVEILWTGWDQDGIIDHYQYTVDVPDDLLDQVDNAEDTGIAWVDTTAFRASFVFQTPEQDSLLGEPIERFRGDHTFYVRAVDNEGLVSKADYINFTATNVTPKTRITVPSAASGADVLTVGRQFNIAWEGLDPDNPDPARQPAYYEWKLKQMPNTWPPIGQDAQYCVDVNAADVPWIRISRDTTSLRLSLQTGFPYILAVRAVDEAGGVETKFVKGMNTLILDSYSGGAGQPELTVRERSQGTFPLFPGPTKEFEMAAGTCIRFEMTGDASKYGGLVQGYNWGVDVDPDTDGPGSGYAGWSLNRFTDAICFDQEGIHTIVLKVRDTGGGLTPAVFVIRVIRFAFDREMLYVDDFRRNVSQGFRDTQQDQRNRDMLRAAGIHVDDPNQFAQFDTFGPTDQQGDPTLLRLSDISAYRMLYWDVLGSALFPQSRTGDGQRLQPRPNPASLRNRRRRVVGCGADRLRPVRRGGRSDLLGQSQLRVRYGSPGTQLCSGRFSLRVHADLRRRLPAGPRIQRRSERTPGRRSLSRRGAGGAQASRNRPDGCHKPDDRLHGCHVHADLRRYGRARHPLHPPRPTNHVRNAWQAERVPVPRSKPPSGAGADRHLRFSALLPSGRLRGGRDGNLGRRQGHDRLVQGRTAALLRLPGSRGRDAADQLGSRRKGTALT
jgi:hypothetical protein